MRLFFGMLIVVASIGFAEPTVPPFGPGERVAFIGDSITHGGMYRPYIETFYATRFPERRVVTFNVGISGDSAKGGFERSSLTGEGFWESDLRRYKPTAAVIMLGMNDAGGAQFESYKTAEELERQNVQLVGWYRSNYARMLDNLEAQGLQSIWLVKSSPYDQTLVDPSARKNLVAFGTGKNDLIVRMGKEVLDVEAASRTLPVIDFNTPMLAINAKQQAADPAFSIIGMDRVHPGSDGHMVMAYVFLKAQGLRGPVATTVIDAGQMSVDSVFNCSVVRLEKNGAGLRFGYLAESLPFPRQPYQAVAGLIPFESEFNQEVLRVHGLADGRYALIMNGVTAGVFTSGELVAGVNMALLDLSPQVIQANQVLKLCRERAQLSGKIRDVVWTDGWLRAIDGLDRGNVQSCKEIVGRILIGEIPAGMKGPLTGYTRGLLQNYLENAGRYDELLQELESLTEPLYAEARPQMHTVEIKPEF
jgi:lysophospholipase L1-like esterase